MKLDQLPKGRFALKYRGNKCLNCDHDLDRSDRFCPNCSQINSTKRLNIKDFVDELLSSIINYDSRLIRTLQALILRPGKITRDYIDGKRIRYTNPFKFLLSLAIIYFLMVALTTDLRQFDRYSDSIFQFDSGPDSAEGQGDSPRGDGNTANNRPPIQFYTQENLAELGEQPDLTEVMQGPDSSATKKILDRIPGGKELQQQPKDSVEAQREIQAEANEVVREYREQGRLRTIDSLMLNNPRGYFADIKKVKQRGNRILKKVYFFRKMLDEDYVDDYARALEKFDMKDTDENRYTFRAGESTQRAIAQPSLFAADLLSKLPFLVFLFIPVFTLFVYLVYIRKNYTYTEHLIFSFHVQSLLFILLIVSLVVDQISGWFTMGWTILAFGIYLYKAMRKFYGQNRLKTIVKYSFLNTVFGVLALAASLLLFFGSLLTY